MNKYLTQWQNLYAITPGCLDLVSEDIYYHGIGKFPLPPERMVI